VRTVAPLSQAEEGGGDAGPYQPRSPLFEDNLDDDHDDASFRLRSVSNIIGPAAVLR
jgi:hypothetical protein